MSVKLSVAHSSPRKLQTSMKSFESVNQPIKKLNIICNPQVLYPCWLHMCVVFVSWQSFARSLVITWLHSDVFSVTKYHLHIYGGVRSKFNKPLAKKLQEHTRPKSFFPRPRVKHLIKCFREDSNGFEWKANAGEIFILIFFFCKLAVNFDSK